MPKYRLFAPGPTPVSERVSLAMAQPIIHHRTSDFEKVVSEVREGLKWLFQTQQEVLIFASSGSGAMEGTISNCFNKGDKVIVVDGGKFGERWWRICQAYGVEADIIKVEWGKAVDPRIIEEKLKQGGYRGVLVQASESSTGVYHPIEEISKLTRSHPDVLLCVDAISAIGATNLPMDQWGIDVLVGGSQKAFGLPPGLAFAGVSQKGWDFVEKGTLPKFYFNWKKERKSLDKNTTAYTPAISIIIGLREVLRIFREEGLEGLYNRHARLARATREAMLAIGCRLYAPEAAGNSLTAVLTPEGIDAQKVYKTLQQKYNMTIAGGQDQAKGKIFRIAHLGFFDDLDMLTVIGAVEMALAEVGHSFEMGKGVGSAMKELQNG